MQIRKLLSKLFVCIASVFLFCCVSVAATNLPHGEVGDYGNWLNPTNIETFNSNLQSDFQKFEPKMNLDVKTFVPIEAKLGLVFMKALSAIDHIFQISLVRYVIIFLLIAYAAWVGLEAYKMIKDSTDYKTVLYKIFETGLTVAVWILILNYGPQKIFVMIVSPILSLGTYLSEFILNAVADTYKVNIPDTCAAIHNYVNTNEIAGKLIIDADTAANVMCLPSRVSVFFYHAVATGFKWIGAGFPLHPTMVIMGFVSIIMFISCIFKFAFMTLGVIADLFLTLLMLPFTAIAESLPPASDGNSIPGRIYNGFLVIFDINKGTKKLSGVLAVFINAALYFMGLSIIIAICAALLSNIMSITSNNEYVLGSAMTTILAGSLILYLANKSDELAKKIGGSIDNSFGKQLYADAKNLVGKAKKMATGIATKMVTK